MKTRTIHGTGIELTELAFGGATLGNLYRPLTDEEARATVDAAWRAGIRYFDTAPFYGLGLSERRLGRALAAYPRDEYVLSTKVGRLLAPSEHPTEFADEIFVVPGDVAWRWDFSRDGVLRSVEDSLERLGLDRIDILYLHDIDVSGIPDAIETGAPALIELRDQGVVRAIGVGTNASATAATAFRTSDIDVAMLAGRYTLLEQRGADEVFEAAGERSVVVAGVFNSGLLATDRPAPDATYDYARAPQGIVTRAQKLAEVVERHGATLPQSALAFPLRNPQIASVASGMRSPAEVLRNVELLESPPMDAVWTALEEEGLIDGHV